MATNPNVIIPDPSTPFHCPNDANKKRINTKEYCELEFKTTNPLKATSSIEINVPSTVKTGGLKQAILTFQGDATLRNYTFTN